jgi:hypothetical protein
MYKTSPHKGGLARLFYTKISLNASTRTSSSSWFLTASRRNWRLSAESLEDRSFTRQWY